MKKGKFHDFDNPGIFSTPPRSSHRYIYSKEVQQVLKKRIGNHCASQGVRWERGKPRSRFQAIREICLRRNARSQRRFPLFTYAGSSDRKIIIRRFLQLWTKPFACVSGVYIHMYTCIYSHRVSGNHHPSFFPLLYPPSVPQSRSLCRTRVRAGLAACGSHFGARSPGVERYRSVPDRKATGFSLRLIRSFSSFRLFTLLVLLVISLPAINVVRGTSTRINRDSRAESLECIYKFRVDSNGRNSSKMKYR